MEVLSQLELNEVLLPHKGVGGKEAWHSTATHPLLYEGRHVLTRDSGQQLHELERGREGVYVW